MKCIREHEKKWRAVFKGRFLWRFLYLLLSQPFDFPSLLLPLHHLSLQPLRSPLRPLPFRMLFALERLLYAFFPVFQALQQLHPRGDSVLMLVTHMKAPDRGAGRMVMELNRSRPLVAALASVSGAENEMLGYIFGA